MSRAFIISLLLTIQASAVSINIYGYIYNIYGQPLQIRYSTEFMVVYWPAIASQLPYYGNETSIEEMVNEEHSFFWSFNINIQSVDQIHFDNISEYDPYIITQHINDGISKNDDFNDEYIVITGVRFSRYAGDKSSQYRANNQSWMIMDTQMLQYSNSVIISYNTLQTVINNTLSPNISCLPSSTIHLYLFYQHLDSYSADGYGTAPPQPIDNETCCECLFEFYNIQIVYNQSLSNFENDMKNIDYFNMSLMQKEYANRTGNGTLYYYSFGGVCSGSFCIDGINWMLPNEILFDGATTASHPTDHTWKIISIIFVILFVISLIIIGILVLMLRQKHNKKKNKYIAAPTTEIA